MEYAENKSHFLQLKKSWKSKRLGATFESQQWIWEEGWKTPTAGRMKLEKKGGKRIKILCMHTQMQVKSGRANWKKDKENHRPPLNPHILHLSAEQHHKILWAALTLGMSWSHFSSTVFFNFKAFSLCWIEYSQICQTLFKKKKNF